MFHMFDATSAWSRWSEVLWRADRSRGNLEELNHVDKVPNS